MVRFLSLQLESALVFQHESLIQRGSTMNLQLACQVVIEHDLYVASLLDSELGPLLQHFSKGFLLRYLET